MSSNILKTWAEVHPAEWDVFDYVCYLGLDHLQPDDVREEAPGIDRSARDPMRAKCNFPYIVDREPKLHQLALVAHYFSAYSGDPKINNMKELVLADDTGLGKTTEMALVIAYAVWITKNTEAAAAAGVAALHKPHVLRGVYAESPSKSARPGLHRTKDLQPVLVVTEDALREQTFHELYTMLDKEIVVRRLRSTKDMSDRRTMYDKNGSRPIVLLITWPALISEYKMVCASGKVAPKDIEKHRDIETTAPSENDKAIEDTKDEEKDKAGEYKVLDKYKDHSIFNMRFSYLFFDEAHVARNPETANFKHGRALARKAHRTFAVTATPVWNNFKDLLNIVRLTGHNVNKTPNLAFLAKIRSKINKKTLRKILEPYGDCHAQYLKLIELTAAYDLQRQCFQRKARDLCDKSDMSNLGDELEKWDLVGLPQGNEEGEELRAKWEGLEEKVSRHILEPLHGALRPLLARRLGSTVVNAHPLLPRPNLELKHHFVRLSPEQRARYDVLVEQQARSSEQHRFPRGFEMLTRQGLLCHFSNGQDGETRGGDVKKKVVEVTESGEDVLSAKIQELASILNGMLKDDAALPLCQQRKYLVYSAWTSDKVLGELNRQLTAAGITAATSNGRQPASERADLYAAFQEDEDHRTKNGEATRVLVLSDCSSAGVNLHRASVLFLLDQPWTSAKVKQIIGRIDRMGQSRPLTAISLVVRDTIDCGIRFAQIRKKTLAAILDENTCVIPCAGACEEHGDGEKEDARPEKPRPEKRKVEVRARGEAAKRAKI